MFDTTGVLARVFARRGQGPGELGGELQLKVFGDTLLLAHFSSPLWHLFRGSGNHLVSVRRTEQYELGELHLFNDEGRVPYAKLTGVPAAITEDGKVALQPVPVFGGLSRGSAARRQGSSVRVPSILVSESAAALDTVGDFLFPVPAPRDIQIVSSGSTSKMVASGEYDGGRIALYRHGAVSARSETTSSDYWIALEKTDLATGRSIGRASLRLAAKTYSDSLVSRTVERLARSLLIHVGEQPVALNVGGGFDPDDIEGLKREIREVSDFAGFQPAIRALHVAEDGSAIWLRVSTDSVDGSLWLVFRGDLSLKGEILVPGNRTFLWGDAERMILRDIDDLGVHWAEVYRIRQDISDH